jgi:hypothetical protein
MGSFKGVKFDAENFEKTVDLAQQKALNEQKRLALLAKSLNDYRIGQNNSLFPDGQYYVTSDFNTQLIKFQGDAYNTKTFKEVNPNLKFFKKGDLVTVITTPINMAMHSVKAIQTDLGNFYADQNKLSKTKPITSATTETLSETKRRKENKTKIMIIGAFILGLLLSKD